MGVKLKSITINGFHHVKSRTYDFENFTYLTGRNASGKTTVLNAIQLALLGYIPGTNKRVSDIFRHANGRSMNICATLRNDDGTDITIDRTWTAIKNNIITEVTVDPEEYNIENILGDIELPVFNFSDFMNMSANKMKDWFIEFLPKSNVHVDWELELLNCLPDSLKNYMNIRSDIQKESEAAIGSGKVGSDQIRWMNDRLKQGLSYKKSELDRITNTIQSMIHYDDTDDSIDTLDLSLKIDDYRNKAWQHNAAIMNKQRNDQLSIKIAGLKEICKASSYMTDSAYLNYKAKLDNLIKEKNELSAPDILVYRESVNRYSEAVSKVKQYEAILNSSGVCPLTNEECEKISGNLEEYDKLVVELKQSMKDEEDVQNLFNVSVKEFNDRRGSIDIEISRIRNALNSIESNYNELNSAIDSLVDVDNNALEDTTNYDNLISEVQDQLIKIEANKKYNLLIDSFTSQKFEIQSEVEAYKLWIQHTGVNGMQSNMSDFNPFDNLSEDMDKRISELFGEGTRCKFNLEAKANSFSFGISRNENYIPYDLLSSGEKCMYLLCLFTSLVSCSSSRLKLILVDDMFDHLDDININRLLDSLYKVEDIQMIFAGVKAVTSEECSKHVVNVEEVK